MPVLTTARPSGSLFTTPWQRREAGGVYVGHNRQVWLYRELPLSPLQWEDAQRRLEVGRQLEALLEEIGEKSRDIGQGLRMLSRNRSVHVFAANFERVQRLPEGTPEGLAPLLTEVLDEVSPAKTLLVGVQLNSNVLATAAKARGGVLAKAKAALAAGSEDIEGALEPYHDDYTAIEAIFRRNETREPSSEALAQLEAWFNQGLTPDAPLAVRPDSFQVLGGRAYEIAAVREFGRAELHAPFAQWLLEATTHHDPARIVSLRAELEPASVTRTRIRRQRRKLIAADEEEAATGDIGREENQSNLSMAEQLESHVRQQRTAWLTSCSILLAREVSAADETYADMLRGKYDIDCSVLAHRQRDALAEMLPTGPSGANPFVQDLNPAMVSYAGLAAFSNIGDDAGPCLGRVDPDYTPLFLDIFGAARRNKPPVMGVFGDPGSGKTFAAQWLAGQFAIGGGTTVFVNPKPNDSLAPWARWVASQGVPVQIVSMSKLEEQGGAFDPFRFCRPEMAVEILARHIGTVLEKSVSTERWVNLRHGLRQGALGGARCAGEALAYVQDAPLVTLIQQLAESSSLFGLAFGRVPQEPWSAAGGLTLIEFDRELPLPANGQPATESSQLEAVAAMRLVTRAALEILLTANGGMLVVDEAHHFLGSSEGRASMDRLGREGRSMGLLPVFATQRVTDLLDHDMETYISRVLAMKLNDHDQASAALTLCRLAVTKERLAFLRTAGPRPSGNGVPAKPAHGIFRDLDDRHSVVSIGPVPEEIRLAMSTNRDDRKARAEVEQSSVTGSAPNPGDGTRVRDDHDQPDTVPSTEP